MGSGASKRGSASKMASEPASVAKEEQGVEEAGAAKSGSASKVASTPAPPAEEAQGMEEAGASKAQEPEKAAPVVLSGEARRQFLEQRLPVGDPADVTVEFMAALLQRGDLRGVAVRKVLGDGVTGDCVIFDLAGGATPQQEPAGGSVGESVLLKFAKGNAMTRKGCSFLYKKEVFVYRELHGRLAKAIPIPDVRAVFACSSETGATPQTEAAEAQEQPQAEADPANFVIAMEDLSVDYDCMEAVKGITYDDGLELCSAAAGLHAEFWSDSSVLGLPELGGGQPAKAFNLQRIIDAPDILDNWYRLLLRDPRMGAGPGNMPGSPGNVDLFPTERYRTMVRLWKKHGPAIVKEMEETVLQKRRLTLIHGDMTPSNVMKLRASPSAPASSAPPFKVIDWQTCRAGSPGAELVQLLSIAFTRLEDLDRLPDLLEHYLEALWSKCPAAKGSYTIEMLTEDYRTSLFIMQLGMSAMMGPMLPNLPEGHFLWKAVSTLWPRYVKAGEVMDLPGYVIEMCERLQLPAADPDAAAAEDDLFRAA